MADKKIKRRALKNADAASYTGLSSRALLDYAHQGRIPFMKVGARSVLFDIIDLDRFLDERKVGAA